jgi:hypothetical protein
MLAREEYTDIKTENKRIGFLPEVGLKPRACCP